MLPFDEIGSGPVIVLLHAGIADRSMWREQLAPLAEAGYRALSLDMARHELIAHAGHLAPLETPTAFRRLLLDFLSEHP